MVLYGYMGQEYNGNIMGPLSVFGLVFTRKHGINPWGCRGISMGDLSWDESEVSVCNFGKTIIKHEIWE